MATPAATMQPNFVLADLIPGARTAAWARDAALVLGGAIATGASAQVAIAIPAISPVPFVLTTLTVLLVSAAYGPARAAASMGVYLVAGMAGVPWFTDGAHGAVPTLGYVLGFVLAAVVVGKLARRGADRTAGRTVLAMAAGSACIYAVGVPYLALSTGMSWQAALVSGAGVFVVTDLIKLAIAAIALPGAWALVGKFRR